MTLPDNVFKAVYRDPGINKYRGNPFIESLTPILNTEELKKGLVGKVDFDPDECFYDGNRRVHLIAQLLDDFFQPLAIHMQLETKLSVMIRQGYVGRNLANGALNSRLQNNYERIQRGEADVGRFSHITSTARSMILIGCSGCGKSQSIQRILSTYPQAIYHEQYNFTQISYLILDCSHDGSLKALCTNFFKAIDRLLFKNYESKYGLQRHSVETLLALMAQIANVHAIGVLVIDEIQHLMKGKASDIEKMMNFFVTMVNVIGVPVVLIGTPKARPIFEADFRAAKRGSGLGALFWEPIKASKPQIAEGTGKIRKTEWVALTDKLWRYQWLKKSGNELTEEIRDCWYDLSQGIIDVVIKLFVLAQVRAIATRCEVLSANLLRQVYEDELQSIHSMIAALRSGDPERIAMYSDLTMPRIDKRLLELSEKIEAVLAADDGDSFGGNQQAQRLHELLVGMDCESDLVKPLVERAVRLHPNLTVRSLIPIVLDWYENAPSEAANTDKKHRVQTIKVKDWVTLPIDDIRFTYSQSNKEVGVYDLVKKQNGIFDVTRWLKEAG